MLLQAWGWASFREPPTASELLLALVLAWLFSDAISGAIHYLADNFGRPDWPLVGRLLILPFRQHHVDPDSITRHDFVERAGTGAMGAGVFTGAALLVDPAPLPRCTLLLLSVWLTMTNEIHAWAHAKSTPWGIRHLQRWGIVLSPAQHARHHRGKHDSHYCITTGFLDRLWVLACRLHPQPPAPPADRS